MTKIFAAAAVGLAALALAPAPVQAQDPTGAAMVEYLFDEVEYEFDLVSLASHVGRQPSGNVQSVTFNLRAGGTYILIGACDENCSDLDLVIRDPSGNEIGRDEEPDDAPMVFVTEARGGRYTVDVGMAACRGSCNWGVRVYSD